MAALAPGVLLKLLKGMNSGERPTNQYRSSLLQITDIVPADLDEKNLYPKHGFYVKVSDSSHSVYVSLPFDQDDLVMSNKIQLGQFIYVDMLQHGSPVPVVIGAKVLPGRHPLVGTPEHLMGLSENGEKGEKSGKRFDFYGNNRSSWEIGVNGIEILDSPGICKAGGLDFDQCTPVRSGRKFPMLPVISGRLPPRDGGFRASAGGGLLGKMMREEGNGMMRKTCVTTPSKVLRFSRSKSVSEREQRINKCSPNSPEKSCCTPASYTRSASIGSPQGAADRFYTSGVFSHSPSKQDNNTPEQGISLHMLLPGKLGMLGKEAVQHLEIAQKIASQAVRDASATDNIVRALKKFSNVSRSAKVDDPESCFNKFLDFHNQIQESLAEMASMQAAIAAASELSQEGNTNTILHEIKPNEMVEHDQTSASKRKISLFRSFASSSEKNGEKSSILGKHLRSPSANRKRRGGSDSASATDENKKPEFSSSSLQKSIDMGKQIKNEAGNWFMDFLEKYFESSKKTKGRTALSDGKKLSQSLILKVINWVEMEQCKIPNHPKASKIARKLRIKMKNP